MSDLLSGREREKLRERAPGIGDPNGEPGTSR